MDPQASNNGAAARSNRQLDALRLVRNARNRSWLVTVLAETYRHLCVEGLTNAELFARMGLFQGAQQLRIEAYLSAFPCDDNRPALPWRLRWKLRRADAKLRAYLAGEHDPVDLTYATTLASGLRKEISLGLIPVDDETIAACERK